MDTLYIVIPAYNEEKNIRQVIDGWYPIIERYNGDGKSKLVVIDDGSKDKTYEIMREYAKTRPYLCPLTKRNSGHGGTVLYGYRYALKHSADYIFQTDSDGQTNPEEFGEFWEQRHDFDMVIGHRNHREDGFSRIVVTKTLKLVIKACFGVTVVDANTPFRLMEASKLKKSIKLIPKNYNLSNVIISVIYAKRGYKVKYIPITFRPRQGGVNSINLRKIVKIGIQAVRDFRYMKRTILKDEETVA